MKTEETLVDLQTKPSAVSKKRIMVAGIGNMFLRDDGFGVEVIKRLSGIELAPGVEINNTGIGGLKLAYDLMKGYDLLILIDASGRGEKPGTLYVIEPDEKEIGPDLDDGSFIDPHGSDPATVLKFIKAIGAWPGKVMIVGCEPDTVSDFQIGLSEPVAAAIDKAVELVEEMINDVYNTK